MLTWYDIQRFLAKGNPQPLRRVEQSDEEWSKNLTSEQYRITRQHGTERAFSEAHCALHKPGKYHCICCGSPLFDNNKKFESGTGWPSFDQPVAPAAIKYIGDTSLGMERVEIQCNVCDAHLGHVFPDGPKPSGLRYCVNSIAIQLEEQ